MSDFVRLVRDGDEPIDVHPSVVEDHKRLGWKVLAEIPTVTEAEAKAQAEAKADEAKIILKAKGKK